MPELPEVETVRRALQADLEGDVIKTVTAHREGLRVPFPKDLAERLRGRRIDSVARRAKYIVIDMQGGPKGHDVFVLHLGMSGRIRIHPRGAHEKPGKHDHLVIVTEKGMQMVFNDPRRFGMAILLRAGEMETHPAFKDLGPEPLGNGFSGPVLARALKGRKTAIKLALLDQHVVAGVGNIYDCEALFHAGISPLRQALSLNGGEAEKLAASIKKVLRGAIAAGGSSLRDYRHTNGETGTFQQKLAVYGREGKACPGCTCDVARTGGVLRISQGGRSTFYCPRKQG
jgi:formamidopyrimidine-DNA glycosylase